MKLILVRHGETEENAQDVLQGWLPGHLSKKGKEQSEKVANLLKSAKFDIVYTSDLKRCVDTTKIIVKNHKIKVIKEKLLRERNFGEFNNKKRYLWNLYKLSVDYYTNKPNNGESFSDVWERLNKFYKLLLKKYSNETILIVAHAGSLLFLTGIIFKYDLKKSLDQKSFKNTSVSEIEIDK